MGYGNVLPGRSIKKGMEVYTMYTFVHHLNTTTWCNSCKKNNR